MSFFVNMSSCICMCRWPVGKKLSYGKRMFQCALKRMPKGISKALSKCNIRNIIRRRQIDACLSPIAGPKCHIVSEI